MDKPKCTKCGNSNQFLIAVYHPGKGKMMLCENCKFSYMG